jgi:hypothetical protein
MMFIIGALAGLMVIGNVQNFAKSPTNGFTAYGFSSRDASDFAVLGAAICLPIFNGAGRIAWGQASDKIGRRKALLFMFLFQGIMMAVFFYTTTNPYTFYIVAALIVRMGVILAMKSSQNLMEQSCEKEEEQINEVLLHHNSHFLEFHKLKTRRNGNQVFAELHLVVDSSISVKDAHDLVAHELVERALVRVHSVPADLEVLVEHFDQTLWVEFFGIRRKVPDVGKQHRDLAPAAAQPILFRVIGQRVEYCWGDHSPKDLAFGFQFFLLGQVVHDDRYAHRRVGREVSRGDVIGYLGNFYN